MELFGFSLAQWFVLVQHELLLFAAFFFVLGAVDEFAVDLSWILLKLRGSAVDDQIDTLSLHESSLSGDAAILIPAWQEDRVIGQTIRHMLTVWPQRDFRVYVGCYPNDPATLEAVAAAAAGDLRVRIVINNRSGPTTKADCLNRLYAALSEDEKRNCRQYHMVLLHDAEDLVDPSALTVLDRAIDSYDFVQLPVVPLPQKRSRWIAGHYCDEFAEAHTKAMVVRDALGAALPAAGVGCAIARPVLAELARHRGEPVPFDETALTEDYEMGLRIAELGGRSKFLRLRDSAGQLIATRAYFPAELVAAVRQKTRWLHGIAFQGWDHMGWGCGSGEAWMRLRDRRGPIGALLLAIAYLMLALAGVTFALELAGMVPRLELSGTLAFLLLINAVALVWRGFWRFHFTRTLYGWREGIRAVLRIPVSNIIAIMAARRALMGYARTLRGGQPLWDKTTHDHHPASVALGPVEATA